MVSLGDVAFGFSLGSCGFWVLLWVMWLLGFHLVMWLLGFHLVMWLSVCHLMWHLGFHLLMWLSGFRSVIWPSTHSQSLMWPTALGLSGFHVMWLCIFLVFKGHSKKIKEEEKSRCKWVLIQV